MFAKLVPVILQCCGAAGQLVVLFFAVIQASTLTVMSQGYDLACGCQTEVLEDFQRLRGGKLRRNTQRCLRFPCSSCWQLLDLCSITQDLNFFLCNKCE